MCIRDRNFPYTESYQEISLHWIISRNFLRLNHIKDFPYTELHQGLSSRWITSRNFLALNHIKKFPYTESYREISLHWIISRSFLTLHHIKKFAYTASHQEISLHCITSRNFLTLHHIKKFPSCFVFTWNLLLAFPGHRSQSLAAEGELRDLCRITYCSVDYHPLRPPAINKQHTAAGNCENLGWTLRSFRWQGLFMSDALFNLHI